MLKQEIGWFDDPANGTGALCSKLSTEAAVVRAVTGQRLGIIIQSYSTILIAVALSIYYEWRLGLVGTSFIPLILIAKYFQGLMYREETLNYHENLETSTKVSIPELIFQILILSHGSIGSHDSAGSKKIEILSF